MKISIVTTAYNAEKYIEETLESVLSQRGDFEIEYIVIDANSTDKTLEKIKKYKGILDSGFYNNRNNGITMSIISESDNGMYEGIAKGFKQITGDVVAYINADDFYMPNAFSCIAEVFSTFKDIKWITGRRCSYNSKGHNIFNDIFLYKSELIKYGIYGMTMPFVQQEVTFWRKDLFDKINLEEFSKFKYAGDFYLWYEFSKYEKIYTINTVLAGFRFLPNQKSGDLASYFNEFKEISNIQNYRLLNLIKNLKYKTEKVPIVEYEKDLSRYVLNYKKHNFKKEFLKEYLKNSRKTKKGLTKILLKILILLFS